MVRMHSSGKGISQSATPYKRSVSSWLKLGAEEIKENIYKLAKKGYPPSKIGLFSHFICFHIYINYYSRCLPPR